MVRSSERAISTRGPTRRDKGAVMAAVAGLILMAASPLPAQTNTAPAGTTPARDGNIYDHRDHQPTAADVGASAPSPASTAAVEREVKDLLNLADRLDRQSEEQQEGKQ